MGLDGTNGCVHVGMPAYLLASMRARANSHAYVCIVILGMCAFVCGCVLTYVICACIVFGGCILVVCSPSCSSQERLSTITQYYGAFQVLHFDRAKSSHPSGRTERWTSSADAEPSDPSPREKFVEAIRPELIFRILRPGLNFSSS